MDKFSLYKFAQLSASTNKETIQCVSFGQTSNLIASGGDDKKVNIFRLDDVNSENTRTTSNKNYLPIQTFSGNQSAVISTTFSRDETSLCTGSIGGTVKVYDVNESKAYRTFTGHLSSVASISSHPYGDFIGTGSVDTSVRVWDIRNKNCVQTYKDHNQSVNCVKFSPDGQWIASSSNDGTLKIYDLVAGKLLHSIQIADFEGSVKVATYFEFHPKEFLLAAISGDSTIQLWNIEKSIYKMDATPKEPNRINRVTFNTFAQNNEDLLLSATVDGMRFWPLNNDKEKKIACTTDFVECKWGGLVGDIAVNSYGQVLVTAFSGHTVKVWAVINQNQNSNYNNEDSEIEDNLCSQPMKNSSKHDLKQDSIGTDTHRNKDNATLSHLNSAFSHDEDMQLLIQEGNKLKQNLTVRLEYLQKLKYLWQKGDMLGCIQMCFDLVSFPEGSDMITTTYESNMIVADFFRSIHIKCQSFMNLNIISKILPVLEIMIIGIDVDPIYCGHNKSYDSATSISYCYKQPAMNILSDILDAFAPYIQNSVHSSIQENNIVLNGGVDLAGEERYRKFLSCHEIIQTFVRRLLKAEDDNDGCHEMNIEITSSTENNKNEQEASCRLRNILNEYATKVAES